jgi:hypothetical protein
MMRRRWPSPRVWDWRHFTWPFAAGLGLAFLLGHAIEPEEGPAEEAG